MDPSTYDDPIVGGRDLGFEWSKHQWDLSSDLPLLPDADVPARYFLESAELKMIETWDSLLSQVAERLGPGERLPGFPIWYDAFKPLAEAEDEIEAAALVGEAIPRWKQDFMRKNAVFYERHRDVIARHAPIIESFPASRRKFEWQAGDYRPLAETIMHFRPSGIRAKRPDYVPALVAITQTSILGDRRRITPHEAARLQGLPDWFEFSQSGPDSVDQKRQLDPASYKQMGNGVNVGAAYFVFREYVNRHRDEIPAHIVDAVDASPLNPDERLADRPVGA